MRLKQLFSSISADYSIEKKILLGATLTGLITSFCFNIAVFWVSFYPRYYIPALLFLFLFIIILVGLIRNWKIELLKWIYLVKGSLLIPYLWIMTGGITGPGLLHFVSYLCFYSLIFSGRLKKIALIGLIAEFIALTTLELIHAEFIRSYTSPEQQFIELFIAAAILSSALVMGISIVKSSFHNQNRELEKALKEINTLRGVIPICSSCKKIRDDEGYWNFLETYIETRSEALFSHSLCPSCADELYGETQWFSKKKGEKGLPLSIKAPKRES